MATLEVSLVTPDGPAFEGEVQMVIVPGAAGEIGVLARHAPLVAMLRAGATRVHVDEGEILEGKYDEVGENDFYMKGGIDEIKE